MLNYTGLKLAKALLQKIERFFHHFKTTHLNKYFGTFEISARHLNRSASGQLAIAVN